MTLLIFEMKSFIFIITNWSALNFNSWEEIGTNCGVINLQSPR